VNENIQKLKMSVAPEEFTDLMKYVINIIAIINDIFVKDYQISIVFFILMINGKMINKKQLSKSIEVKEQSKIPLEITDVSLTGKVRSIGSEKVWGVPRGGPSRTP